MKRWIGLILCLFVVALFAVGKWLDRRPLLMAGETLQPVWSNDAPWKAGKTAALMVRLEAVSPDGARTRDLSFRGIPDDANPVATVTFFEREKALPPTTVPLSHRC